MPIDSLRDLSDLTLNELYSVYLAIALADHRWRIQTLHGDHTPPVGQAEFRPLSIEQFHARLEAAQRIVGGETMLRDRLARQAAAYHVDIDAQLDPLRQAA
ncbi:MAG: hypothetical protein MI861_03785 [Pirellulales bacterium]|nr:hypothetical protein [Pirellulales bacterium]